MSVTVSITDTATPMLERIGKEVRDPRSLLAVIGRAGANRLKKHFRAKDSAEPNKMGGRRTHFWNRVASSVFVKPPEAAFVSIGVGHVAIRQKFLGGTITAKRRKFLTIPLVPEAYGRTARTYARETGNKLFRFNSKSGNKFFAERAGGGLRLVYLLRQSVIQKPAPGVLPDDASFSAAVMFAAQQYLEREKKRWANP